jgi:S1-C subfamily serine protease
MENVIDQKRCGWRTAGASCLASLALLFLCAHSAARDATRHAQVKSGTGFFVSRDGFVVTSAHVVAGCTGITLWRADEAELIARIVAVDAPRDIALLSAAGNTEWYADRVREGASPHAGDPVSTIGFGVMRARPREPWLAAGQVIGGVTDTKGFPLLLIRADLREGNSGGPVIDTDGTLLGMVAGATPSGLSLAWSCPLTRLTGF